MHQNTFGIAWYHREQWELLKACADDSDGLAETYERWLAHTSRQICRLMQQGIQVQKVWIDIGEWLAWCELHHKSKTAASRSEFVAQKLTPVV